MVGDRTGSPRADNLFAFCQYSKIIFFFCIKLIINRHSIFELFDDPSNFRNFKNFGNFKISSQKHFYFSPMLLKKRKRAGNNLDFVRKIWIL